MRLFPGQEPQLEEAEDAILAGDRAYESGTARAALRHRSFRIVWIGTFASNIGTWMQTVALGAFAIALTKTPAHPHGSTFFVALLQFVQLGPLLILASVGGLLADMIDRRKLIVATNLAQLFLALLLAWVARSPHPETKVVLLVVLGLGIANALTGAPLSSLLPTLVAKEDLAGAVSLQSVQMNLSRVIGPVVGGLIFPVVHVWGIFAINAVTYLFAVAAIIAIPPVPKPPRTNEQGWHRLVGGFRVAREDPLVSRLLLTMAAMSFFSLPFVGLFPSIAENQLGLETKSSAYGILYACFGMGAALGAISVGTVFARCRKPTVARRSLVAFGLFLGVFGALGSAPPAYPTVILLGFAYFCTVTCLSSTLQQHLEDSVRGRVMALWIMSFGGTVPIGLLVFGKVADLSSLRVVLLSGAVFAILLALVNDIQRVHDGVHATRYAAAGYPHRKGRLDELGKAEPDHAP